MFQVRQKFRQRVRFEYFVVRNEQLVTSCGFWLVGSWCLFENKRSGSTTTHATFTVEKNLFTSDSATRAQFYPRNLAEIMEICLFLDVNVWKQLNFWINLKEVGKNPDEKFHWNASKFAILLEYENPCSFFRFSFRATLFFSLMNAVPWSITDIIFSPIKLYFTYDFKQKK